MLINNPKIYHLIDLKGKGTIYNLLLPLCTRYRNHILLTPDDEKATEKINSVDNCYVIIHSTGSINSPYLFNYKNLFFNKKICIFMHVSYEYMLIRGRSKTLEYLKEISITDDIVIFTPSKEVSQQFRKYGIKSYPIQIGIPVINNTKYKKNVSKLMKYYGKIITTCTSASNDVYFYAKGIDNFYKIIKNNNLTSDALIAGNDYVGASEIFCKKFEQEEFLNVLCHSKLYIQCSRYETYNITAVQAKRMKIPTIILSREGTPTCMNGYVFETIDEMEKQVVNILNGKVDIKKINKLYYESIFRENIINFKKSLENSIKQYVENKI